VAGYPLSSGDGNIFWYSHDPMEAMQKPSLGFDYIQRLSGTGGDWGMLALQVRAAYDTGYKHDIEPQLYNAYLKLKPGFGDLWIGHNKPAFGLSSYLDNHGTLLQPLSMYGIGYDRDWGAGFYRDWEWGNTGLSLTSGSGMPLYLKGNYMLSTRISKGDLNRDNYNIGLSGSYGKNLSTMGYHLINDEPWEQSLWGVDATVISDRFELKAETVRRNDTMENMASGGWVYFARASLNAFEENRLKFELQYLYDTGASDNYIVSPGLSYLLNSDLTLRFAADISADKSNSVAQLYWYHKL
jgi:hypothetical protein